VRRLSSALAVVVSALVAAACSALPWPGGTLERTAASSSQAQLRDLRGVVHVHTRISADSRGTPGELIDAAHAAGLDWIALTEHTRSASRAPSRGVVEGIRLIPGYEMSAAGGSILALGVIERPPRSPHVADIVRAIHAQGGVAIVGHLESSGLADPAAYLAAGVDGIELVNLHANAEERGVQLALGQLLLPAPLALRTLIQTPLENLRRWSALPRAHSIVAGVDAHAKFRLLGRFGGTFDRYRDMFRIATTHVMATDASEPAILEALRLGRSYVAFEALAPVEQFRFELVRGHARIEAPRDARLVLACDAGTVESPRGRSLRALAPEGSRHCHAEAWLGDRLWIVTSRRSVD
jgi:hypothetical protein